MPDAPRGLRELDDLVDDFGGRRGRAIAAARGGATEERVLEWTALVGVEPLEHLADERAKLLGVERA